MLRLVLVALTVGMAEVAAECKVTPIVDRHMLRPA
eukprot:SAG11_NODE_9610_length_896_cov_1.202008_1_plen_34_part_10